MEAFDWLERRRIMKRKEINVSKERKTKVSLNPNQTSSKTSQNMSRKDVSKESLQINVIPHQKSLSVTFNGDIQFSNGSVSNQDRSSQIKVGTLNSEQLSKLKYKNSISINDNYNLPKSQKSGKSHQNLVKGESMMVGTSGLGMEMGENVKRRNSLRPVLESNLNSRDNWLRQSKMSMCVGSDVKEAMLDLDLWKLKDVMEKFPIFKLDLVSNLSTLGQDQNPKRKCVLELFIHL